MKSLRHLCLGAIAVTALVVPARMQAQWKSAASVTGTPSSTEVANSEPALAITSGAPPRGTVGYYYHFRLTASGGTGTYHWHLAPAPGSELPQGLEMTELYVSGGSTRCCVYASGIGGTPRTAGTYRVVVTVTDSSSPPHQANATYDIMIASPSASDADAETRSSSAVQHPRYKLIDLGTFGGPNSFYFSDPVVQSVNNRGTVVGGAETPAADPFAPNCQDGDCLVLHGFEWRDGRLRDLGTLPGGSDSTAYWGSDDELIFGNSENGQIDPLTGLPEYIAVVWKHGQISSLGTLGGGFSYPNAMNNRDQIVGLAQNAIPDPFSFIGVGTQTRAVLWETGAIHDLGTLGGPDAWAASINDKGEIAGWALVDSKPNATTGQPTQHPFLWRHGTMMDLGTLGGTSAVVGALQSPGAGASINNKGQIIGTSNLAGDLVHHPFLWDKGELIDLGTFGGDNGEAWWINDAGEIVGRADLPGSSDHHAFLWKNGKMIDLGASPQWPCSTAIDINSRGQVIIDTGICGQGGGPGLLWEDGQTYDLNDLIPPNSGWRIGDVNFINDRGEIAVTGILSNGDQHAVLLIPCDDSHQGVGGCD